MRTILQDGILYFLMMAGYLMAGVFINLFTRVITFPPSRRKMYSEAIASQPSLHPAPAALSVCVLFRTPVEFND